MTATHTRTHTFIEFANPFLVCDLCRQPVPRWHNNDACGCDTTSWNDPCGHPAEAISVCPSWSPLDGCLCLEFLGTVDHAPAEETNPA
ncbi:hypothetical protein [Streptomyces sp. MJP52]|uniref:hypothetical protein n=1 Tax=Streptomyces sp. MJP52 TaxID=2940555 RepID=UPI00247337A3|nr:hypothetical protein [Streptomyces sp. MJP52]MDH6226234.1 hypothetical protein [Streptomyces sp. MJP52]